MNQRNKKRNIVMFGHKRIPSREGGVEIVVEELSTRMAALGHRVTCYNRGGTLKLTIGGENGVIDTILLEGPTEVVKVYDL